jgi:hypothetical protein
MKIKYVLLVLVAFLTCTFRSTSADGLKAYESGDYRRPGARENPPTRALEKPTRHKSWMTLLYPPGEGGRVVHFSVVGSLVGTA